MTRAAVAIALAGLLTACATAEPETAWKPRTDAALAADLAACTAAAEGANLHSADAYSNGSFGAAAAAAGQLDRSLARSGQPDRVFRAVRDSCMERKGWVRAE